MNVFLRVLRLVMFAGLGLLVLAGCQDRTQPTPETAVLPTRAQIAEIPPTATAVPTQIPTAVPTNTPAPSLPPPTWTPEPTLPPLPTNTAVPTATPLPTNTPIPLPTRTPIPPTNTPVPPTATSPAPPPPSPTIPAQPILGANLLPNPSFEEGWYNQNGIPELQLPNRWQFEWDEGSTGFGSQVWDVYVRPETRVLPAMMLPPHEHPLFIFDGQYTVKIFKDSGAISFRLWTNVTLEPGTYVFEINFFPDLVVDYDGNRKVWAPDPLSGDVQFLIGGASYGWNYPIFGRKNTLQQTFTVTETRNMEIGVWIRGRFAILNNGWFLDDWSLRRIEN